MKKVMVFGTFDIFHLGHKNFFKQANNLGDFLIVVVARNKTVLSVKKKKTLNSEQERLKIINDSGLVDEVVLGGINDKYAIIKEYKPDIICLGYDQKFFIDQLKNKLKEMKLNGIIIKRLKPYHPEIYKSSKLR